MSFVVKRLLEEAVEGGSEEHGEHAGSLTPEELGQMEEEEMNEHYQPLILFFVFFGLLIGGILREFNKKTKFPYTPMLIIVGIIMGHWAKQLGVIGESTIILSHINPHILLFAFIPVLIFESAFNCDCYPMINILTLAAPGVLFGALLLGIIFKVFLGYGEEDMTWWGALMAGSVLSATDPVAVVALLKELGANPKFGTLIEGEALLNDGTAMVFYQLFLTLTKGQASTPAEVLVNFVRIAGGGPLLGLVFGFISSVWLRKIVRDDVLTSTITFFTCYLVFFCAEFTFLHVSGILSVVVLGLFMSAYGKIHYVCKYESEHAVHTVWAFTQYGCETIIFLLTGVLIGIQMIEKSTITQSDWIKLLIFYVLSTFARAIMVLVFMPILKKTGYGLSTEQFYVLVWGGLRGALGITLSLMVGVDMELPYRLRELTVFYMAGLATLTLLINGTTCKSLVLFLKLIENPPIKDKLLRNAKQKLYLKTMNKKEELSNDKFLNLSKWEQVDELIGLNELKSQIDYKGNTSINKVSAIDDPEGRPTNFAGCGKDEVHGESRFRILRTLKGLVWERYEHGHTSGEASRILDFSINVALEHTSQKVELWQNVRDNFTSAGIVNTMFKLKDWPILGGYAKSYITSHLALVYESTTTFIQCLDEAIEIQENSPFKTTWIHEVIKEFNHEVDLAEKYLSELMNEFEHIVSSIHTKRAAMEVLEYHKKFARDYHSKGYIDDLDLQALLKDIDRKIVALENHVFNWKPVDFQMFVMEFPVFKSLEKKQQYIQASAKSYDFNPGDVIFKQGDEIRYVYVVMKGTVREESKTSETSTYTVLNGVGALLGYGGLVFQKFNVSTCSAVTKVHVKAIEFDLIKRLIAENKQFEERIYKGALVYCVKCHMEQAKDLGLLTETQLNRVAHESKTKLISLAPGTELNCSYGAYVFSGEIVQIVDGDETEDHKRKFKSFSYIPPKSEDMKAKKCKIF